MSTGLKIAVTVALVAGGVGYMIFTTVSSGEALEYYKQVDEVMPQVEAWRGKRLQLHGNVVEGTIVKREGSLDFRFAIHRGGHWVDVHYTGLVPDSFKDCAEVVVKGQLAPGARLFEADVISGKCPSKYDEQRQANLCGADLRSTVLGQRASR